MMFSFYLAEGSVLRPCCFWQIKPARRDAKYRKGSLPAFPVALKDSFLHAANHQAVFARRALPFAGPITVEVPECWPPNIGPANALISV
jgi:hypothetical protein